MTQAAPAGAAPAASSPRPRRAAWVGPLLAGLCFGVAYGVTQRLISLNVGEWIRFGQGFDVQVFPGTSLESLRLRFGDAETELRGDLELQQLQRQGDEPPPGEAAEPGADAAAPDAAVQPTPAPDPAGAGSSPEATGLDPQPAEQPPAPMLPPPPAPSAPAAGLRP